MLKSAFSWTDDAIAEAREMWSDGKSTTEIADFFTISRSAVAGMIGRNRDLFAKRGAGHRVNAKPKAEKRAKAKGEGKAKPAPAVSLPKTDTSSPFDFSGYMLPDVQPISFLAIGRGECRWPLSCDGPSAGADMLCCGAETGGMVYCPVHATISRGRGTESERTAHKAFGREA